ncbi:hypothetical protein GCM10010505_19970 [Kitasatospora aburaviensis]
MSGRESSAPTDTPGRAGLRRQVRQTAALVNHEGGRSPVTYWSLPWAEPGGQAFRMLYATPLPAQLPVLCEPVTTHPAGMGEKEQTVA